jgi:hypothetical protein
MVKRNNRNVRKDRKEFSQRMQSLGGERVGSQKSGVQGQKSESPKSEGR